MCRNSKTPHHAQGLLIFSDSHPGIIYIPLSLFTLLLSLLHYRHLQNHAFPVYYLVTLYATQEYLYGFTIFKSNGDKRRVNNDRKFVDDARMGVAEVWQPQGMVWGLIVYTHPPSASPGQRYRHLEPKHGLKGSELKTCLSHLPGLKLSSVHT